MCATPLQFETFISKAISICFLKQIGRHKLYKFTKMADGDERHTIQFGFLRYVRSYVNFLTFICKKKSAIILKENIKNFRSNELV